VFGTDGDDLFWGQLDQHDESFYGLGGGDRFHTSPGDDRYICGHSSGIRTQAPDGRDTVDYGLAEGTVRVTLSGQADDGQPGEHDTIFDCDAFVGGLGTLTVQGTGADNVIDAQGGGPIDVHGNGGNDTLSSSSHGVLYGDAGNDALSRGEQLHGGEGDDVLVDGVWLLGGPGNDAMVGGPRNTIFLENPGEGTDTFLAGLPEFGIPFGGPDAYFTKDGVREIVACGSPAFVFAAGPPAWGDADDDYRDCF
jgi:hypothetical protein